MEAAISLVIGLAIIGGIVYLVFRPKGQAGDEGRDAYFYIVAFLGLVILFWAAADLGRVILEQQWVTDIYWRGRQDETLRKVSLRLATILVTLPVFAFHWFKASMKSGEEMDQECKICHRRIRADQPENIKELRDELGTRSYIGSGGGGDRVFAGVVDRAYDSGWPAFGGGTDGVCKEL
ncbi:MAG: hypothetical protein UY33_C0032G0019 [Candidatus Amesbacteria bacterium GW2011_GWA1_48_9]|uniref:DUF5671 domain-containing protein n=1 Tax=Candidatus Amesbacteria bacterium GW2011_GWA1_48_9 TaxID=1618355 RepID=A0A0G1XYM8_9BACT|nr:MAG: hypothetical protein UY33_C0032G0019 [Candidatus Amesbacteria bacterium GW2011_GWA1_48_9]